MKLSRRLRTLAKTVINDVLGEDTEPQEQPAPDEPPVLRQMAVVVEKAQADLDALRLELAKASDREKRIAHAHQAAFDQAQSLDEAVDAALRDGDDERAAGHLKQAKLARTRAEELDDLLQACQRLTGQIQAAVETRQGRLSELRGRYQVLADRADTTEGLESLTRIQQELARQTESLRAEFSSREEQIIHREDRLAARQDWSQ
jgi:phage shock protein A